MAKQKYMMTADDIAEELNCSKSYFFSPGRLKVRLRITLAPAVFHLDMMEAKI